jgi:uncharacterized membrane protein YcgQ (UPF0703/DUF1980 family)
MVEMWAEQQHGPIMLNSISMNKQYSSLKENQSSKATDSNWIATLKAYEHSKMYYCKKNILLVCKNPSISNCAIATQHI